MGICYVTSRISLSGNDFPLISDTWLALTTLLLTTAIKRSHPHAFKTKLKKCMSALGANDNWDNGGRNQPVQVSNALC